MARAGKQHIVRIRESIYDDVRRKKEEDGRVEGVNQYIENILSEYVRGVLTKGRSLPFELPGSGKFAIEIDPTDRTPSQDQPNAKTGGGKKSGSKTSGLKKLGNQKR